MSRVRTRVVAAHEAGYGHGSGWLAQYRDADMGIWFDIGAPCGSPEEAESAAAVHRRDPDRVGQPDGR